MIYTYEVLDIFSGSYGTLKTRAMFKDKDIAFGQYEIIKRIWR